MPNPQKEAKVREIAEQLSGAQAAVLAGYRGLTVQEAAELRSALSEVGARFTVVKNSLTLLAVKEAGLEGLGDLIDGPTAIAYVQGDAVAATKRLVEQGRRFPVLEIRGGYADGRILSADDVRRFATLESREVMLATLAGMAKGQMARTARMLQALQSKLALLMDALREKLPDEPSAPDSGAGGSPSVTRGVPSGEPPASGPEPEASAEPAPLAGEAGADGSSRRTETEQAEQTTEQKEGGA
jgi:large subunit ribosomal protein L10